MSVSIKTSREIELMRTAGKYLEEVHEKLAEHIQPGISTWELDRIGEEMIRSMGCIPNFLNYNGFPASFCISLNDEVVHGIPSHAKVIQEGDLVKIDAGLIYKGYHFRCRPYLRGGRSLPGGEAADGRDQTELFRGTEIRDSRESSQ